MCVGNTLNLNAPTYSGGTYSWTSTSTTPFTSTLEDPSIPNVTTNNSGTYSLVVTVAGCPSSPGTVNVAVNAIPSAPTAGSNSPVCVGFPINLTASTVSGASSYNWTHATSGYTSSTQNPTIASAALSDGGTYYVTATVSGCTSTASGSVSVTVNPIPTAPSVSSNSPVCEGSTLNLTASTVGTSTYAWTGPASFSSSSQNPSRSSVTLPMAGNYTVTPTDKGCVGPSATVNVTINAKPLAPAPNSNTPICQGQTILLTQPTVSGANYAWTGPNGFASNVQNPTIPNATSAEGGTYNIIITVNGCSSSSGSTSVAINQPATVDAGPCEHDKL